MTLLLRYYDRHWLLRRAAAPILSNHYDGMLARLQLLGEMPESPVRRYIRHGLAIDNQCRTRLCASHDLRYASVKLRCVDMQNHFLRFALCHHRKFESLAYLAGLLLAVHSRDIPEIIAGVQPADLHAGARDFRLLLQRSEHRRGAHSQLVRNRVLHRFPFKTHRRCLRVFVDDRRKIQRLHERWRSEYIRFLNSATRSKAGLFPLR